MIHELDIAGDIKFEGHLLVVAAHRVSLSGKQLRHCVVE